MDREALQTSYNYSQIWEQHFKGGYFSEGVKEAFEAVKDQSEQEKRAFYAQQFEEAFGLAQALQAHVGAEVRSIDLSDQGLGVIEFATETVAPEETEDNMGYRGLQVRAVAFDPQIEGRLVYTNPGSLEDNSQHIATEARHPKFWERNEGNLYLPDNGQLDDADSPGGIDDTILWLLDAKETLEVAAQALHDSSSR